VFVRALGAGKTDRAYWQSRATKATLTLVDQALRIVREFDVALEPKYTKVLCGAGQ